VIRGTPSDCVRQRTVLFLLFILMSQLSLEDICLSFCRDTALEILALRTFRGRETAQFARKRASARRRLSALSHDKNPAHLFFKI